MKHCCNRIRTTDAAARTSPDLETPIKSFRLTTTHKIIILTLFQRQGCQCTRAEHLPLPDEENPQENHQQMKKNKGKKKKIIIFDRQSQNNSIQLF